MQYYIKQKIFALADKYNVYDENDNRLYYVKTPLISPFKHKKFLFNKDGKQIMYIRRKIFDILPNYMIYDENKNLIARIRKTFSLRKNFKIYGNLKDFSIKGDFFAWSWQLLESDKIIGTVSKKFFKLSDTYCLDVENESLAEFFIGCVIVIDNLLHDNSKA